MGVILAMLLVVVAAGGPAGADPPSPPTPAPKRGLEWRLGRTPAVHRADDPAVVSTRVGGWMDASYQDNDRSEQSTSLNLNHLNLFFDSRYRDRLQLFLEVEFENNPDLSGFEEEREYEVEQLYLRYGQSDRLQLRAGRFNVPLGYWIPAHWSILMDTIQPPIHVGNRILPEQAIGLELSGRLLPGEILGAETEIDWALYSGTVEEPETDGLAWGADLRTVLEGRYLLGASVYVQRNKEEGDRSERNLMLYGQAELPGRLTLRGEYLRQDRDRHTRLTLSEKINVTYAKLRWDFRKDAYLNYRYAFGDDDTSGVTLAEYIHTLTLGYRPVPSMRIKLEWSSHRFRDPGREAFVFWGASFGYLF